MSNSAKIQRIVQQLYKLVGELEGLFPERKFTLDGHLVGSIGEVVASERYNLTLRPASSETHDAETTDKRAVQIKATQRKSVALSSEPKYLIVLQIDDTGQAHEVYNGLGKRVWESCGKIQKNGQRRISLSKLMMLQNDAAIAERIPHTKDEAAR